MPFEERVNKMWALSHRLGRKEHEFIKGQQFSFPAFTFRFLGLAWTLTSQAVSSDMAGRTYLFQPPAPQTLACWGAQVREYFLQEVFSHHPRPPKLHILSYSSHSTLWLKYSVISYILHNCLLSAFLTREFILWRERPYLSSTIYPWNLVHNNCSEVYLFHSVPYLHNRQLVFFTHTLQAGSLLKGSPCLDGRSP